jgi:hypothetical protein
MPLRVEAREPCLLREAGKTHLLPNRSVAKNFPTIASYRIGNAQSVPRLVFLRDAKCASPIKFTVIRSRGRRSGHFQDIAAEKGWIRSVAHTIIIYMHWILPVGVFNPNNPGVPETAGPLTISDAIVTSSVALVCFISRIIPAKTISSRRGHGPSPSTPGVDFVVSELVLSHH